MCERGRVKGEASKQAMMEVVAVGWCRGILCTGGAAVLGHYTVRLVDTRSEINNLIKSRDKSNFMTNNKNYCHRG